MGRLAMTVGWVLASGLAPTVQAQDTDAGLVASVGLRAWNTAWTTFGYDTVNGEQIITQSPAKSKLALMPVLSLRYGNFGGTFSGYGSTKFRLVSGSVDERSEYDLNLSYFVMPNVALNLGYKRVRQSSGLNVYDLKGPILGANATAPLGGTWALYGSFGFGQLGTGPQKPYVDGARNRLEFDARYRLTEVGLAYNMVVDPWLRALTVTLGYRTQVFDTLNATTTQDARDLTHGLTFGLLATF
jgi:hypothetical protein